MSRIIQLEFKTKNERASYYLESSRAEFKIDVSGDVSKVTIQIDDPIDLAAFLSLAEALVASKEGGEIVEKFEDGHEEAIQIDWKGVQK